ncbi:hypothetical protein [Pelobacter propionicus]|uniref:hypothetical protein n=1 Tax=Pelobacter propionicus TaxID=29543 RepID=UPI0012EE127B|nr:hypothetical protein [Pelobacter propionicus]
MKKHIIFASMSLLVASSAFAGTSITMTSDLTSTSSKSGLTVYGDKSTATAATAALIGKTSTGVSVGLLTSSLGYAVVTQHKNGTKAFGSSYDSTSVFSSTVTEGTALLTVPTAITSADFTGTWTSM